MIILYNSEHKIYSHCLLLPDVSTAKHSPSKKVYWNRRNPVKDTKPNPFKLLLNYI